MVSLTMLALSYTHSRVSTLEGTSPIKPNNDINNNYEVYETNVPEEYHTQPTLYHPEDSLRKRREASNEINQFNQIKFQSQSQPQSQIQSQVQQGRETRARNSTINEKQTRNLKLQNERRY